MMKQAAFSAEPITNAQVVASGFEFFRAWEACEVLNLDSRQFADACRQLGIQRKPVYLLRKGRQYSYIVAGDYERCRKFLDKQWQIVRRDHRFDPVDINRIAACIRNP
jgi:hypothetical protein